MSMSAFQKRILNGGMITPVKAEQQKEDAMAEESLYYNQLDERWQSIYWGAFMQNREIEGIFIPGKAG